MKKDLVLLCVVLFILSSCGKITQTVKNVAETTITEVQTETQMETADDATMGSSIINDNEEETIEEDNDFMAVLDALKEVHPGTAGSSLKVLYAGYKFLNSCRTKLPFDRIAEAWVEKQNKDDYPNINESFTFVYDSLDDFNGDNVMEILSDAGVEFPEGVSFEGMIDDAKRVLNVVIEKTK